MRIIGLCGKAGAGKDTAADYMVARHGFIKYSMAQPIKAMLNAGFGWKPEQWNDRAWKEGHQDLLGSSPRVMAQTLGTEWGRERINGDLWVRVASEYIRYLRFITEREDLPIYRGVVVADIRFINEATWINSYERGMVLQVVRPPVHRHPVAEHKSEDGIPPGLTTGLLRNDAQVAYLHAEVDATLDHHFPGEFI